MNTNTPEAIGIIEPVGGHGGMDYYDYGLAYGLGVNKLMVFYFTCDKTEKRNFNAVETIFVFKDLWSGSFLAKSWKYIQGHLRAFLLLKKRKVRIIHLHFFFFRSIDLLVLLLAKSFRFLVIVTVHDINSFHNTSNKIIERSCYKLIDGIIVHNQSSYHALELKLPASKNIAVIPHGNYLPFIKPVDIAVSGGNVFTILFFGQIKEVKGLDILLNALSYVLQAGNRDIKLLVKGKGYKNDLSRYIGLIEKLGLAAHVDYDFRYIPDEEVAELYAAADLVVLPYREIYQSGVLLLTMSYGKPVLCSDLAPFKEIIDDRVSGMLFKSGDSKDLANQIRFAMDHREVLANLAERANDIIRKDFDWVRIGASTKAFYERVLNKNI